MNLTEDLLDSQKEVTAALASLLAVSLLFVYFYGLPSKERKGGIECMKNIKERSPVWQISKSEDWRFGKMEGIELVDRGNYIKLKDGETSGKWVSAIKNWGRKMKYYYADVDSEVARGEIRINFQVSDNNFKSVKETISKKIFGGLERLGLCNLDNSTSMKVEVKVESNDPDKELTALHGIWIYIKPLSNRTRPFPEKPGNYSKGRKLLKES